MSYYTITKGKRGGFNALKDSSLLRASDTLDAVVAAVAEDLGCADLAARIMARPEPVAKTAKEWPAWGGWMPWKGGVRPEAGREHVEVLLASGEIVRDWAENFRWEHYGNQGDVICYRRAPQPDAETPQGAGEDDGA